MKTVLALAGLLVMGASNAQTVIYDTFNENQQEALFDCCNVAAISTRHSDLGKRNTVAVPFTPSADARITEIDLALSYFSGQDANLFVIVDGSSGGLPGREKHMFHLSGIPAEGQCCAFQAVGVKGIPVKAGGTYWVEVKANRDSYYGWNLNTLQAQGAFAIMGADGWMMTEGPLPAVRIIAR